MRQERAARSRGALCRGNLSVGTAVSEPARCEEFEWGTGKLLSK